MFIMFKHTKSSSGSQLLFLRYNNSAVTDLNGNSVSNHKAVNSDTQKSSIFKKFKKKLLSFKLGQNLKMFFEVFLN